jgi:hypothetical protein
MKAHYLILSFVLSICITAPAHAFFGLGEPPLSVVVRPAVLGALGKVVIITNTSDKTVHQISVSLTDPKDSRNNVDEKVVALSLKPDESIEVGWMQDYGFRSGEKVIVRAKGFLSRIIKTIP